MISLLNIDKNVLNDDNGLNGLEPIISSGENMFFLKVHIPVLKQSNIWTEVIVKGDSEGDHDSHFLYLLKRMFSAECWKMLH